MFKNKILHFFFLIFISVFVFSINFYTQNQREIHWGPDDYYQYLSKSSYFKICTKENLFCEKNVNFILNQSKKNLTTEQEFFKKRQIQRILIEYNNIYTFLIEKLSNLKNQFSIQIYIGYFFSIFQCFLIYFYLKEKLISKILIFSALLVLLSHAYYNNLGIIYFTPASFSLCLTLYASLFVKKKFYLSLVLFSIAILFHKISIFTIFIIIFSFIFYIKFVEKDKINISFKKIFLLLLLFFFSFKFTYNVLDIKNISIHNIYSIDNIVSVFKNNFLSLLSHSLTFFSINIILLFFFLYSFFLKKITLEKIIFISLLLFSIFFPLKGFIFGDRNWHIIIVLFTIVSFAEIEVFLKKGKLKKSIFFLSLFFFFYNGYKLKNQIDIKIHRNNYFIDTINLTKINSELPINSVILFVSNNIFTYAYLSMGFFKHFIIEKDLFPDEKYIYKTSLIVTNALVKPIVLKTNDSIEILSMDTELNYKIYCKNNGSIKINNKYYYMKKGLNTLYVKERTLTFYEIKSYCRIIGINKKREHTNYWDYQNLKFNYNTSIVPILDNRIMGSQPLFFSVRQISKGFKNPIKYSYNMNEIYSNLLTNLDLKYNDIIKKNKKHILIWDRDSTMIFKLYN